ncbi:Zinc finger, GRF-type [Sesbania bispinosa]|nr:Zinc finger, GRF-type [Sesbania bispinosa]
MKVKTCGPEQRYSASKSSSSSSISRRLFCACGDELLLMKSESVRNPGRMFWRCPNWATENTCNFFRWADGALCDEGVRAEEWQMLKHENEELKRKIGKLQMKLGCERRRLKLAVCIVVLLMGLSFMVCALAMVNCDAVRKTM